MRDAGRAPQEVNHLPQDRRHLAEGVCLVLLGDELIMEILTKNVTASKCQDASQCLTVLQRAKAPLSWNASQAVQVGRIVAAHARMQCVKHL